jgi:hypothetical protein
VCPNNQNQIIQLQLLPTTQQLCGYLSHHTYGGVVLTPTPLSKINNQLIFIRGTTYYQLKINIELVDIYKAITTPNINQNQYTVIKNYTV